MSHGECFGVLAGDEVIILGFIDYEEGEGKEQLVIVDALENLLSKPLIELRIQECILHNQEGYNPIHRTRHLEHASRQLLVLVKVLEIREDLLRLRGLHYLDLGLDRNEVTQDWDTLVRILLDHGE